MKINSASNQSFGSLYIDAPNQRKKILKNLNEQEKKYLLENIKNDPFKSMWIKKNNDVYICDLFFDKPIKMWGDNLISKVRNGIENLRSKENPDCKRASSNNNSCGGEVASPGYCCGYGGYGCSW